jgi:ATP-dependent Clp protease ATP-binding subunit ClpA
MFERFTDPARQCVAGAQEEAFRMNSGYIGTQHLLISLAGESRGLGGRVLRELGLTADELRDDAQRIEPGAIDPDALATLGIDLEEVRRRVEETFGHGALSRGRAGCGDRVPFSRKAKKTLELALHCALDLGDNFIGSEHMLLGLVACGDGTAQRMLAERELDIERLETAIREAREAA